MPFVSKDSAHFHLDLPFLRSLSAKVLGASFLRIRVPKNSVMTQRHWIFHSWITLWNRNKRIFIASCSTGKENIWQKYKKKTCHCQFISWFSSNERNINLLGNNFTVGTSVRDRSLFIWTSSMITLRQKYHYLMAEFAQRIFVYIENLKKNYCTSLADRMNADNGTDNDRQRSG